VAETAVVTGANRGIGLEVVRQLAGLGMRVVLTARDPVRGDAAARTVDGDVLVAELDVSEQRSVEAFAHWADARLERVDVLVNNAAILYDTWATGRDADLAVVHRAFETNLFGAWRVTQALLPLLDRSANARIVNVSSEGGSLASMGGGTPAYSVSKAALNALTRVLAGDLPTMRVNAVCPGWTATDMGAGGGRPVAAGAASVVWAATLDRDGPTGRFFRDGRPVPW
jgi:NAD(P)-dependent dehydrogenase (short-subunit alcohol dehydrogenase family)